MARASNVHSLGVVSRFSEATSKLRHAGDYVTVVRGVTRAIVMSCPDGCGETLTVNLDRRAGPAWRKYEKSSRLTVYPSVWRESGCRAHFIVWNDCIIWCGPSEEYPSLDSDERLAALVLSKLSTATFTHYEAIAESLDAIPWEVYWACKDLFRAGRASQGKIGTFRRIDTPNTSPPQGRIDFLA
jgi:hypothetical protein